MSGILVIHLFIHDCSKVVQVVLFWPFLFTSFYYFHVSFGTDANFIVCTLINALVVQLKVAEWQP